MTFNITVITEFLQSLPVMGEMIKEGIPGKLAWIFKCNPTHPDCMYWCEYMGVDPEVVKFYAFLVLSKEEIVFDLGTPPVPCEPVVHLQALDVDTFLKEFKERVDFFRYADWVDAEVKRLEADTSLSREQYIAACEALTQEAFEALQGDTHATIS
jgi:hypothetical protein